MEKLIDEQAGIGMASKNMNAFMQYQTARAMRDASRQEGGLAGLGAGFAFGRQMNRELAANLDGQSQGKSSADKLREYKALVDEGVLSKEEFEAFKKKLLGL